MTTLILIDKRNHFKWKSNKAFTKYFSHIWSFTKFISFIICYFFVYECLVVCSNFL